MAHCIVGGTLDDLIRSSLELILSEGREVSPTKGPNKELIAVSLELTEPRARLCQTESRGRAFSALGELVWYLSRSNDLAQIAPYIRAYAKSAEDGKIFGGYGPRLFDWKGTNQIQNVIDLLRANPTSRRAAVQLFDAEDLVHDPAVLPNGHLDIPCTCTMQFLIRDGALSMVVYMRSNDVWKGLPHDVFCFTMLQEIVAVSLDVPLGRYHHTVGSLHLYNGDKTSAEGVISEGWQSSTLAKSAMPAMPRGDPWGSIEALVEIERRVQSEPLKEIDFTSLDPYWADFARLLQIYASAGAEGWNRIDDLRAQITSKIYDDYVVQLVERRRRKQN